MNAKVCNVFLFMVNQQQVWMQIRLIQIQKKRTSEEQVYELGNGEEEQAWHQFSMCEFERIP